MPHVDLPQRLKWITDNIGAVPTKSNFKKIPKDRHVTVVCANGKASKARAFLLLKDGFNASALKSGMGTKEGGTNEETKIPAKNGQDISQADRLENDAPDKVDNLGISAFGFEARLETLKIENERLTQFNCELEEKT